MFDVPILLIVFNRPATTSKLIEAIREVKPKKLFISADGPRESFPEERLACESVRKIINKIDWECEIETLYHKENQGCHWAPRKALQWFFSHVEEGIILEDDCIPNKYFFLYCKELLLKYRNDERIFTINGGNLGYNLENGYSYTFSRFMNMTGWATWRRTIQEIDYNLKDWKSRKVPIWSIYKCLRQSFYDTDFVWFKYWKHKFDLSTKKNVTWWDWHWINYQVLNKRYSIVPSVNLVTNIGFGEDATHTKEEKNPAGNLQTYELSFPLKHPLKLQIDITYEENYVKWVWCYHRRMKFSRYVFNGLKNFLS